jgi:integrase
MSKSPTQLRHIRRLLTSLPTTQPQTIHLRDGELVLYRRSRSLLYQCRYKLADGAWHRQSAGKASLEHAIAAIYGLYDVRLSKYYCHDLAEGQDVATK